MLFGVFVVLVVGVVAFAAYSLGALLGNRPRKQLPTTHVVQLPMIQSPPPAPLRVARGTTPQPFNPSVASVGHDESRPRGVISNREDATEPEADPDARFSIRRSSKRIL